MELFEMKLNHALREFTEDEMMHYFRYCEQLFDSLSNGTEYNKRMMTDGKNIYIVHFYPSGEMFDKQFIAKRKVLLN